MPAPRGTPDEFACFYLKTGIGTFSIHQRSLKNIRLLDQDVLVVGQGRARLHLHQDRRKPALGIEQQRLELATGAFSPRAVLADARDASACH